MEGPGAGAADSLLAGACVFFTLCMFSSSLSDLRRVWTTQSVDRAQFLPFLIMDVNTLGWLSYGALKGDRAVVVVNVAGAVLQTLYVAVYLRYSPRKRTELLKTASLLGLFLLAFSYFWLLVPKEEQLQQLGLVCSFCTICMYLSPMAELAKVIQTRSAQRLSLPLTVASLFASACWTLYGFRLGDPYIMVPNCPGIITSSVCLWLFWKYRQEKDRSYQLLQT